MSVSIQYYAPEEATRMNRTRKPWLDPGFASKPRELEEQIDHAGNPFRLGSLLLTAV